MKFLYWPKKLKELDERHDKEVQRTIKISQVERSKIESRLDFIRTEVAVMKRGRA